MARALPSDMPGGSSIHQRWKLAATHLILKHEENAKLLQHGDVGDRFHVQYLA